MATSGTGATNLVTAIADAYMDYVPLIALTGQVPSGPDPHEVITSEDGRFAYISNYGGGTYNTITPVDLSKPQAMPPMPARDAASMADRDSAAVVTTQPHH